MADQGFTSTDPAIRERIRKMQQQAVASSVAQRRKAAGLSYNPAEIDPSKNLANIAESHAQNLASVNRQAELERSKGINAQVDAGYANQYKPTGISAPRPLVTPTPPAGATADYSGGYPTARPYQGDTTAASSPTEQSTTGTINRPVYDESGLYALNLPEAPRSLADIRAEQLSSAQKTIDATQAAYEEQVQRLSRQGRQQAEQAASINVSAGLAGSPFATASQNTIGEQNAYQLNTLAKQRAGDISQIMSDAEKNAQNLYQQGISNFNQDRAFYVSERDKALADQRAQEQATRKAALDSITNIAKSGYSIDEMNPDEYKALLAKSGMTDFEARAVWAASNPAANANYSVQNGFLVGTYFDPHTGKPVVTTSPLPSELATATPPDVKSVSLADGSVIFYDANQPYGEDGKLKTIDYNGSQVTKNATGSYNEIKDGNGNVIGYFDPKTGESTYYNGQATESSFSTLTDKQQKDIEGSTEAKQLLAIKDLRNKLNAYKNEVNQPGGFDAVGSRKNVLDSLYADLQVAYKEAANLGAITGPDLALISAAIKPSSGASNYASYLLSGGHEGLNKSIDTALNTITQKGSVYADSLLSKYPGYENDPYIRNLIGDNSSDSQDQGNQSDGIVFNQSYGSIGAVTQAYPELQGTVDTLKSQGYSEDQILQYLEQTHSGGSFTNDLSMSQNGSTGVQKVAAEFQPGEVGGQCGHFVNKHVKFEGGARMGDSYQSKIALTDPSIGTQGNPPRPGDVFVFPYSWTGHTGIIDYAVPLGNGRYKLAVIDSNYHKNEKIDHHFIDSSIVTGYARPAKVFA